MCAGIALAWSELPTDVIGRHGLERRAHDRGGEREVRFLQRDRLPRLPVWRDGRLQIVRWGNSRGQSRYLPRTCWTWMETINQGGWRGLDAVAVDIPATLALERGVWFRVRQGLRGLLVPDERGGRRRLHDLRAGQPLLPGHDPLVPHARPDRGADLIGPEMPGGRGPYAPGVQSSARIFGTSRRTCAVRSTPMRMPVTMPTR